jgi:hypothetical protein
MFKFYIAVNQIIGLPAWKMRFGILEYWSDAGAYSIPKIHQSK